MSVDFLVTTLIVVATPGTGVLYTLAAALARGARASVVAAFGCTLGIVPHMVAAITGLAAVLNTSALAFQVLKYLGVAYLLYMAWSTLREQGALSVEAAAAPRSAVRVVFAGYGMFAAAVRSHVLSRPRVMDWVRRVFAGAFVALGARLAFTDR